MNDSDLLPRHSRPGEQPAHPLSPPHPSCAKAITLNLFLSRMVWFNILPLVLLAIYLSVNHLHTLHAQRNREAGDQARNVATAIDKTLNAQISALQLLAASPLLDDPLRLPECYQQAQAFHDHFGGHVILADLSMQMLFNTRVPLRTPLPKLPKPKGNAAAPAALATAKPAVGDMFLGPVARENLVAVAVPVIRGGQVRGLLLNTLETRRFQLRLDAVALPEAWSVTLRDGNNEVMARRSLPVANEPSFGRTESQSFVARLSTSAWSVVVEIPRSTYLTPLIITSVALATAIIATALISVINGRRASRALTRAVDTLTATASPGVPVPVIAEIENVRGILADAATAQELASAALRENEARDLIEREAAEKEIRTLNASLEERVRQRTDELLATNRELETFTYSVSHDLRAPLRAIDGYTRILLEDHAPHLDPEGVRVCGVISDSARRMDQLIDDLLAFSRLGRTEVTFTTIDMTALAGEVFADLTTPRQRELIDFRLDPLAEAQGDPALLRQVWANLLGNAIKFSAKKDRPRITVEATRRDDQYVYAVRDNGAGFDMDYIDKLFGVFQRLHSEKEFSGTGLGLAIVQRIVERHGGKVWAEAQVNQGATFFFTLA